MRFRRCVTGAVSIALGAMAFQATAACTDRTDPLASPVAGVTLVFNDGAAARVALQHGQIQEDGRLRQPALVPSAASLPAGRFGPAEGQVVYLESDDKGGRRVCRLEQWESRVYSPLERAQPDGKPGLRRDPAGKVQAASSRPMPGQQRNPILAKLTPHYFMTRVDAFFYDAGGHLVEARMHETPEITVASNHAARSVVADRLTFCARYDAQGRMTMASGPSEAVSVQPGFQCSQVAPDTAAMTTYAYYPDGTLLSQLRTPGPGQADDDTASQPPSARGRGQGNAWLKDKDARRQEALFNFIPKQGIYTFATHDMGFATFDAQPPYEQRSTDGSAKLAYDFPTQPVPLSVIDDQFASLDRYPRIRTYPHRSGSTVMEFFDANRRAPRQRQWRGADLNRQEMYGANGKLTRVIHYGGMPQEVAREDLKRYAESGVLKVTPTTSGYASYRVYDYDATGRERLVFVCWQHDVPSNRPLRHFPWWTPDPTPKRSKEDALIYGMKNVANRCGTPDGKMLIQGLAQINAYMAKQYGYDVEKLSYDDVR